MVAFIQNRLSPRQFLFLAAVLIGISMGFAAVILKTFVHYVFLIATFNKGIDFNYYYVFIPIIGILLSVAVVVYLFKGKWNKGVGFVHESVIDSNGYIAPKHMYGHILTSSLTVGMGGSAGLEAPIAVTGAAFGSNFSKRYTLSYKDRILLIACGAAAGVAAAFNAPIAGVLFALEVLLLDIAISAFIPLIIASASGALVSNIILKADILLQFKSTQDFNYNYLPFYIVLGLFCGLLSVYHARFYSGIQAYFFKRKWNVWQKAILGGSMLSLLIFLFPTLFGEGYESLRWLAENKSHFLFEGSILQSLIQNDWILLLFVGMVMLSKALATGITISAGGNGGNFAPALFVGAYGGFFLAKLVNLMPFKYVNLPVGNFTLVGMAGVLAGLYHAPLTAIFLIAEITGGYNLMIPLMVVASISYAISHYFEPYAMDVKELVKDGKPITADKDTNILSGIRVYSIMETNIPKVSDNASLKDLIEVINHSSRNIIAVVNEHQKLEGIVSLDSIRSVLFNPNRDESISVRELMTQPPSTVKSLDTLDVVMQKFDKTGSWNLPVVDKGVYLGFVSKAAVFNSYRSRLKDSSFEY